MDSCYGHDIVIYVYVWIVCIFGNDLCIAIMLSVCSLM